MGKAKKNILTTTRKIQTQMKEEEEKKIKFREQIVNTHTVEYTHAWPRKYPRNCYYSSWLRIRILGSER